MTPAHRHRPPRRALGCAGARLGAPRRAARPASAAPARRRPPADAAEALSARAQRLFDEAVQAQEEQEKPKAHRLGRCSSALARRARRRRPAEARYNLGVALERQGKLAEARAAYQRALAEKPLRQAAVNLARAAGAGGRSAAAPRRPTPRWCRDLPEDGVARARLGALYRESGQLDEAWRLSREALLRDAQPVAPTGPGRVALQRGDLDLARLVALRAQKVAPTTPRWPTWPAWWPKQGDAAAGAVQCEGALAPARLPAGARRAARVGGEARALERRRRAGAGDPRRGADERAGAPGARRRAAPPGPARRGARLLRRGRSSAGGKLPEVHLARGILLMRAKNQCEPALEELRTYARQAGPVAAAGPPRSAAARVRAGMAENQGAQEAAKAMQADAERKAAEAAARPARGGPAKRRAPAEVPHPHRAHPHGDRERRC